MKLLRNLRALLAPLLILALLAPGLADAGSLTLMGIGAAAVAAGGGGSPPVFASAGAGQVAGGTSIDLDKPSGLAVNDLMVAMLNAGIGGTPTWTYPSGWSTAVAGPWSSGSNQQIQIAYKVATSGDVAASTFNFQVAGSGVQGIAAAVLRVTGASTTAPFNVGAYQQTTTGTTGTFPTVTTTAANTLIMQFGNIFYSSAPSGSQWPNVVPAGSTLFTNVDASCCGAMWAASGFAQAAAGSVPAGTVSVPTTSSANDFQAVTVAIAPP